MRIAIRSATTGEWRLVESADYDKEAELQKLLAGSPSLIPAGEIREGLSPLVVAVREFGLSGSGSTDLLAFSADGDVAVCECKLAAWSARWMLKLCNRSGSVITTVSLSGLRTIMASSSSPRSTSVTTAFSLRRFPTAWWSSAWITTLSMRIT